MVLALHHNCIARRRLIFCQHDSAMSGRVDTAERGAEELAPCPRTAACTASPVAEDAAAAARVLAAVLSLTLGWDGGASSLKTLGDSHWAISARCVEIICRRSLHLAA